MSEQLKSIDVAVPLRTAYAQWTQFEEFPRFMEGVEAVRQIDDTHLHWRAKIGGATREWDAEITEQRPDQRIAWTSRSGARHAGAVDFHRLDDTTTRVVLDMEFDPDGVVETAGDKLGFVARRVEGDLKRFKAFIEDRHVPTGAWRGEVPRPDERRR